MRVLRLEKRSRNPAMDICTLKTPSRASQTAPTVKSDIRPAGKVKS